MAKTLVEIRNELDAKRKRMATLFEEAGPEMDMSKVTMVEGDTAAKAAKIKEWNDELTALGIDETALVDLAAISKANTEALEKSANPANRLHFSGDQNPGSHAEPKAQDSEEWRNYRKGFGQLVSESETVKGYQRATKRGPVVEIKFFPDDIAYKTLLTETGYAPQSIRTGLILPGALRRPVVADLIPQGTTSQIAIVYMEETTTTNAAAATSEGNAKPESAIAFTERTSSVRKIATVLPITDELINDVPAMRAYVEARLRVFLELAEENNLVSGDGNAPNLLGITSLPSILTQAKGADPTPDAVYKAMVKIQVNSFLDPSGVVFNPLDWQDVRLLRTADGIYIWGSPSDAGPDRIWGLPVISTTAMTQNTAVVGAWATACQIFRRAEVTFAISDQNEDFFIKNKLMLRVEERLAFAVYRQTGFCTVTGI